MKRIIILSTVVSSFIFATSTVEDLTLNQISETTDDTTITNNAYISQGKTDIENGSNVKSVTITQEDSGDAGNLIKNSSVAGNNSEVHQGYTSINNGTLNYAEITSQNELSGVTITGDKSVIRQGNLIIGGASTVAGSSGSGGPGFPGGGVANNIVINQQNYLKESSISDSNISQGVTEVNGGANVSLNFNLNQINDISVDNTITSSNIRQGVTTISGGSVSDIENSVKNKIETSNISGLNINQSTISIKDSTVKNINNNNDIDNIDEKNRITQAEGENSNINQSTIDIENSLVDGIHRQERPNISSPEGQNNWIYDLTLNGSDINQSAFISKNGSTASNITYTLNSAINSAAVNNLYSSTVNNSTINQDVTELNNASITGENNIDRLNIVNSVTAEEGSHISQSGLIVTDSQASNLNLSGYNIIYNNSLNSANLSQGETIITN